MYRGYSYWLILDRPFIQWLWYKIFCKKGWHLWDEVYSIDEHYLFCDACGEKVNIK